MFRKYTNLLMTAILMFATVFAVTNSAQAVAASGSDYTITIDDTVKGHTYSATQIFSGISTGKDTLMDIHWGKNVNGDAILQAVKKNSVFEGVDKYSTAEEVSKAIKENNIEIFAGIVAAHTNGFTTQETATGSNTSLSGLAPGYYLIQESAGKDESNVVSKYIVKVVGYEKDITVKRKNEAPTMSKEVKIANGTWTHRLLASYKSDLDYKITFNLPEAVQNKYDTYPLNIVDTRAKGLDIDLSTVKIMFDKIDVTKKFEQKADGLTTTWSIENLLPLYGKDPKTVSGDHKVVVTYKAKLNSNANLNLVGNDNTARVEYSMNPNVPNSPTGHQEDKAKVMTVKLNLHKHNESGLALKDVKFTLTGKTNDGKTINEPVQTDAKGDLTFNSQLGAGSYTIHEERPEGYAPMNDIKFTISETKGGLSFHLEDTKAVQATTPDWNTNAPIHLDVTNKKWTSLLPTTGGSGTVALYLAGAILLISGVIFAKRRKKLNQ